MTERDNPISARSKRLITEALLELMQTVPFSKISIRDIVDRAGLTRQTFYHNFESKEEVLIHKQDELFDGFFQYLVDNKIATAENLIWFYFRYWQRNVEFVKLLEKNNLTSIMAYRFPEYFKIIQVIYLRDKDLSDTEAEYIYSFIAGAMINLLLTWVRGGMVLNPREMASLVMKILDGGFYDLYMPEEQKKARLMEAAVLNGMATPESVE